MEAFRRDLALAARSLRRDPRFSVPTLVTLAVGTGAGLALLHLVDGGLRRPVAPAPPPGVPIWEGGWSEGARTVARMRAESVDALLQILGGATLLVVLVICVNLAVLLLSRAAARRPETAMRVALGAGGRRLARQLWTEVGLLSLLGGVVGFMIAGAALAVLHATWPASLPGWLHGLPSTAALGLSVGLPLASAVAFGLAPLRLARAADLHRELAAATRATPGPHEGVVRRWLVVLAVASAVSLLVGSGLLLRSFAAVDAGATRELGLDPRDTLTIPLAFAGGTLAEPGPLAAQQSLLERIGAIPGVRAVSLSSDGSWFGQGAEDRVRAQCGDCFRGGMWLPVTQGNARHHVATPGFFAAMGTPLLSGREFAATDDVAGERVAVINRSFANIIFTGRDPLGRPVQIGGPEGEWYTVVGVVADIRARGPGMGTEPAPAVFLSALQHPPRAAGLAVRTAGDPLALAAAVESALHSTPGIAVVGDAATLQARLDEFAAPLRWFASIFATLAILAALVAGVGVAGVVSYTVTRRTREIGVRMALGADARAVVAMIVRQTFRLVALGAWLGILAALSLARLLQVLFLGVAPLDPVVYGAVLLLIGATALLASVVPARHAAAIDPAIALRSG